MKIICVKEYKLIYTTYSIGSTYEVDKKTKTGYIKIMHDIKEARYYPNDKFVELNEWRNIQIDKIINNF
jgi:hypothetical protein